MWIAHWNFYNDLDNVNKISSIIKDSIPISVSTANSNVDLIEIELQGNHDYLIFGSFANDISADITIVGNYDCTDHNTNINHEDYEIIFSGNQRSSMIAGGGTISILGIRTFKDIKVVHQFWNYYDNSDYNLRHVQDIIIILR